MTSKAVQTAPTTEVEASALTTRDVLAIVNAGGKIRLKEADDAQMSFTMLAEKLDATTGEDLFSDTSGEVVRTKDIIGRTFQLTSVEFRNADLEAYPEGLGIYAVLHVILDGKPEVVIAGGADVVLKAMRAVELGVLPRWLQITSSRTKSGRDVQNLVDAADQTGQVF